MLLDDYIGMIFPYSLLALSKFTVMTSIIYWACLFICKEHVQHRPSYLLVTASCARTQLQ